MIGEKPFVLNKPFDSPFVLSLSKDARIVPFDAVRPEAFEGPNGAQDRPEVPEE